MHRFWDDIVKPIFKEFKVRNIVEVGSKGGDHTYKMIEYCSKTGGFLHSIDPGPEYDYKEFESKYHEFFKQYTDLSLNVLYKLNDIDAVLIDGDHNWYTVFNELKLIDESYEEFPIVFFHDISWPYGRRDLYYNPDEIPEDYRKPYLKKGILPNKSELDDNGINSHLFNAAIELNDKNGVLTAIEDFIDQTNRKLDLYKFDILNGFGILIPVEKNLKLKDSGILDDAYLNLLSKGEQERINYQIESNKFKNLVNEKHSENVKLHDRFIRLEEINEKNNYKIKELNKKYIKNKNKIIEHRKSIKNKDQIIYNKNKIISSKNKVISSKNKTIMMYSNSISWKITKPLRKIGGIFRKIRNNPQFYILLKSNIHFKEMFRNLKAYNIIKKSDLFDEKYYTKKYPSIRKSSMDPLIHYIYHGYSENKQPSGLFNAQLYLNTYKNVKKSNINPLVHYVLYGKDEGKEIDFAYPLKRAINRFYNEGYSNEQVNNILNSFEKIVSIIIPIYNAYEDTKKCITSILENTTLPYNLILINDNSSDERINELLDSLEHYNHIFVINNEENKGFTKNINIGFKKSKNDVVILNSDTIVTPKWLQKLLISAYSEENIATVTPFSNASDISIPEMNKNNKIPDFLNINQMASFLEKVSLNGNLVAPTGNGFCMFIKRKAIDDVGIFDENSFGKGYGEETDFTMRAKEKGWKNIRNDSIFIYHKRSASFSSEAADTLKKEHKKILEKKHTTVYQEWEKFIKSKELRNSLSNVRNSLKSFNENLAKENLLYITRLTKKNLPSIENISKINKDFNVFALSLEENSLKLWYSHHEKYIFLHEWKFRFNWSRTDFNRINFNIITSFNIDKVFVKKTGIYKKMEDSPFIVPVHISNQIGIPIIYGRHYKDVYNEVVRANNLEKEAVLNKIDFKVYKYVVYTAIIGDYDNLKDPEYVNSNFDYICFTDNKDLKSDVWDIRIIENLNLDNTRKARRYKILPHKYLSEYDYSLWVDAAFRIIGDLEKYLNKYLRNGLLLGVSHSKRNCIYEEAKACIGLEKDNESVINSQIKKYKDDNYPKNNGLIESGVLFRKHNDTKVIKLMEEWYDEIIHHSKRDQLSFDYVMWKNDFEYDKSNVFYWKNEFFEHSIFHNTFYESINKQIEENNYIIETDLKMHFIELNQDFHPNFVKIGVFLESDPKFPNGTYSIRIFHILNRIAKNKKYKFFVYSMNDKFNKSFFNYRCFDAVIIQRLGIREDILKVIIDKCEKYDIKIIYEIDDDLLTLPETHHAYQKHSKKQDILKLIAKKSEIIIVSTDDLKNRYLKYNNNVGVVKNYLVPILLNSAEKLDYKKLTCEKNFDENKKLIKIGYFGTSTHKEDFLLIKSAVKNVVKKVKDRGTDLKIDIVGIFENNDLNDDWINIYENRGSFSNFWDTVKNFDWDIGIAPLSIDTFNSSKSELKYIEYTSLGVPTICSNVPAYNSAVKDGFNGFLAKNPEEWEEKLEKLVMDGNLRKRILKNAVSDVNKNYLINSRVKKWEQILDKFIK